MAPNLVGLGIQACIELDDELSNKIDLVLETRELVAPDSPVFFEQLHGALFADHIRSLRSNAKGKFSIGGEIRLNGSALNLIRTTLRLGCSIKVEPNTQVRYFILFGS